MSAMPNTRADRGMRHTARQMRLAASVLFCAFTPGAIAQPNLNVSKPKLDIPMLTRSDVQSVSPALDRYTQEALLGELWKRPELSSRDRSIVTVAALIARNQTVEMPYYFKLALDSGVKPAEMSEIVTHLAFY